jgi:ribosomal protein S18 acetylase RimI-like enzyme
MGAEGVHEAIEYRDDARPDAAIIAELYRVAALARPVDDLRRIATMYASANLIISAWQGADLVGILRAWSDGAFFGYIADLAVHPRHQRRGIGRELLQRAVASNLEVQFLLHAAPAAADYYGHIGWQARPNSWGWPRER